MFGVACQRRANVEACKFARLLTLLAALALCLLGLADFGYAQQQQQPPSPAVQKISILLARELHPEQPPPLSLLDQPNPDDGVAGAKLGVMDNNTTGKFMGQEFALDVVETAKADELVAEVTKRVNAGSGLIIVDADPKTTLAIADAVKGKDALVINYGSPDDCCARRIAARIWSTRRRRGRCSRMRWRSISCGRSGTSGSSSKARAGRRTVRGSDPAIGEEVRRQDRRRARLHLLSRQPSQRRWLRAGAAADPHVYARRPRSRHRHGGG